MGNRVADLVEHIDHTAVRMLQDILAEATAAYWEQRAREFEWVVTGVRGQTPTPEELHRDERSERNAERALACRNAAEFWRRYGFDLAEAEVDDFLAVEYGEGVRA